VLDAPRIGQLGLLVVVQLLLLQQGLTSLTLRDYKLQAELPTGFSPHSSS
jgi:hypothetical protein